MYLSLFCLYAEDCGSTSWRVYAGFEFSQKTKDAGAETPQTDEGKEAEI